MDWGFSTETAGQQTPSLVAETEELGEAHLVPQLSELVTVPTLWYLR